jgi:hypothetical protein
MTGCSCKPSGLITNKKISVGCISSYSVGCISSYIFLQCFSMKAQLIMGFTGLYCPLEHIFKKKALQNQNLWNKRDLVPCTQHCASQQLLFPHCIFVCNKNSAISAETYEPCKILTVINTSANDRLVSYTALTFQSLPMSLRTTRFNIQESYLVITLSLQVCPYIIRTNRFL